MNTGEQEFTVYAARCADGTVERHAMNRKSVWLACLADLEKFDQKPCGPHTLLSAVIFRSAWKVAVEPDQTESSADVVKAGALKYRCPRCGVAIGRPCENLTDRRRGTVTLTSWPHPDRIELWAEKARM